jgi:hypothetical protein
MMKAQWEKQFVRKAHNPRSDSSPVSLYIEFDGESDPPIRLRVLLPVGLDYLIPLTWQEWELMNAWLHSKLLETQSSDRRKESQGFLGDNPFVRECGTRG